MRFVVGLRVASVVVGAAALLMPGAQAQLSDAAASNRAETVIAFADAARLQGATKLARRSPTAGTTEMALVATPLNAAVVRADFRPQPYSANSPTRRADDALLALPEPGVFATIFSVIALAILVAVRRRPPRR